MKKEKTSLIRSDGFQTLLASLVCILGGILVGYIALLIIEPSGAFEAIVAVMKSFFRYPGKLMYKYFGQTLVRTVPLLLCALSVLFAYKVGMFNIGAAGQYCAGACACLYGALAWNLPWYVCLILGMAAGAALGAIAGALKTLCNVNVVISGIMLNWITLYLTNLVLAQVKSPSSPYTKAIMGTNPSALLPSMGLEKFFNNEKSVTIAIPVAVIMAIVVWVVLNKTKFGYELKATGNNYNAAKYAGMKENRNIILTMPVEIENHLRRRTLDVPPVARRAVRLALERRDHVHVVDPEARLNGKSLRVVFTLHFGRRALALLEARLARFAPLRVRVHEPHVETPLVLVLHVDFAGQRAEDRVVDVARARTDLVLRASGQEIVEEAHQPVHAVLVARQARARDGVHPERNDGILHDAVPSVAVVAVVACWLVVLGASRQELVRHAPRNCRGIRSRRQIVEVPRKPSRLRHAHRLAEV